MCWVAYSVSRRLISIRALYGSAALSPEVIIGPVVPARRAFFKRNNVTPNYSIPPRHQLALPFQSVSDDRRQLVVLRLPAEHGARAIGAGHELRRIAGAAIGELDFEIDAGHALDSIDDLEHRESLLVTAIQGHRWPSRAQIGEGVQMRPHQVGDVDVIANTGSVRRRIVGAEDLHGRPPPKCGLDRNLDEMGCAFGRLAGARQR